MSVFFPTKYIQEISWGVRPGPNLVDRSQGGKPYASQPPAQWTACTLSVINWERQESLLWRQFAMIANKGTTVLMPIATKWRTRRTDGNLVRDFVELGGSELYQSGTPMIYDRDPDGTLVSAASGNDAVVRATIAAHRPEIGCPVEIGGHVYWIDTAYNIAGTDEYYLHLTPRLRYALPAGEAVYFEAPRCPMIADDYIPWGNETPSPAMQVQISMTEHVDYRP